jgi:4-aminobutyrate aminotransferase
VKSRKTRERATDEAEQVMYRALDKGLSFKLTMGNILLLTPPLIITREQLDFAIDVIDRCLYEVEASA